MGAAGWPGMRTNPKMPSLGVNADDIEMITSIYRYIKSRTSYMTALPSILSILSTLTLIISLLQSRDSRSRCPSEKSRLKNLFHIHLWPFLMILGGSFLVVENRIGEVYIESGFYSERGSVTPVLLCAWSGMRFRVRQGGTVLHLGGFYQNR